jgi:MOSC domain-containing protein YiiM
MATDGTATSGTVVGIFTAAAEGAPTVARHEVTAVAQRGLEGDRYFEANTGTHDPADEITLITAEALRRASTEHGVELDPGEHRRNIVVDGVDLLALVGRTVQVGGVSVEVMADNPPCRYLRDLTGKPVVTALRGGGGVRGRITTGGVIRTGDGVAAV